MKNKFKIKSKFKPAGDQPKAIEQLLDGLNKGYDHQTLLGVTGSGKTFTMANVIAKYAKPALVIAHNKTLAAQLCNEFREFFPENAVHYFVSYYDYYQPEAYLPRTDTYIEKEAMINDEIDRLRHAATQSLLTRRDVIIVASVSCIYGLGAPETYEKIVLHLKEGEAIRRDIFLNQLITMQFNRTNVNPKRGEFRLRGEILEIMPVNEETIYRIVFDNEKIKNIIELDPVTRKIKKEEREIWIYPAKHFVILGPDRIRAFQNIEKELKERLEYFNKTGKLLEAERLERRTNYDLEMMREVGYCHSIENYSRHLSGRQAGDPPDTLLDYFSPSPNSSRQGRGNNKKDWLMFIDESHVTVPQISGMYGGDASRKKSLIDFGFRLPSAADNRPLKFNEFEARTPQTIYTSATPSEYELGKSKQVVEQIIRPTGLLDPEIIVRPITEKLKMKNEKLKVGGDMGNKSQVEDLMERIIERVKKKERILVTTLTKKMAEDLSDYLEEKKFKVRYIHSEVKTLDRIKILTEFRRGVFDILIGVNLLREGLDLPEVTLVAILDADKEGFLRSETSLIQTIGRAARNVLGQVVLYADNMTGSMERAIKETERRRKIQAEYNKKHNITPKTIKKAIKDIMKVKSVELKVKSLLELDIAGEKGKNIEEIIKEKEKEMKEAAQNLQFELAALLRDEIRELRHSTKVQKIR
ncbi:excinuclease ABC subunit B [Candidatus Falkowbacteria bacterium RIFOXYB2_FULL_38_15]|uniref:UvrABC system protein B n=1 Tax=Candidatus Falkowbacteria bacterium RIFOXYA2_FULL_38_12 TaxID=1797993 RepID=A0A1F5S425_9BACT|nr:MAG: excinuclease ABC subunit B [Candidatus Falkowbacteria bacterium RIFOXYA2_FULL_38_12]OGF32618.1 MAG: excinuclease ABC subunit B [Candidatus Falkowbacteria bacterium RIFOXYB2_FULL_38_15]OGF44573.1 MAG: excinuclease ABC subunit B [Candidatus Falkowbacteria bacterium RIFOXYD2_FULL_39_16]